MATDVDSLYELLPVVYRERDAEEGHPLRALLRIVGQQVGLVEQDIEGLWDDFFIETCRPWVIPYIGDLIGNRLIYDASRLPEVDTARQLFRDLVGPGLCPPIAIRSRADVGKTIYYRRRKATLPVLEEMARDVAGWPAHAVEFRELLGWTQHLNHLRFQSSWADLREVDAMSRIDGAFDEVSHTVDVRWIDQTEGWHNIRNIGFFLFRLGSHELERVPARKANTPWRYHFSPLGNPTPLFSRWRREGDEAGLATELHVAAPIRRALFAQDLTRYREMDPPRPDYTDLYGLPDPMGNDSAKAAKDSSFVILHDEKPVTPDRAVPDQDPEPQIISQRLDPWPSQRPSGWVIAVDVETGRLALGDEWDGSKNVDVYCHHGFPADLGGGSYERGKWLMDPSLVKCHLFVREGVTQAPDTFPSVEKAIQEWNSRQRPDALITILDSRTYNLPTTITLPDKRFLVIEAANRERPLLKTKSSGFEIKSDNPVGPDRQAALTLSGVVVEGHLRVTGDLGRLRLLHATLVPGRGLTGDGSPRRRKPSLEVEGILNGGENNAQLRIEAAFSVLGALWTPEHADGVWLLDCLVDALGWGASAYSSGHGEGGIPLPGAPLHVERSTVVGRIDARSLWMSESIVTGQIETVRTQAGCVRFSYVAPGSHTPRRFRCQPELALRKAIDEAKGRDPNLPVSEQAQIRASVEGSIVPGFTALEYGHPAYAQLRAGCPKEIRTGAEDGSEMGAYCHLKQPQREANLRLRLEEYLPFGLDAGLIHAT